MSKPEIARLLYDQSEVVAMLNISKTSLWREMKKGTISFVKIGSKPLFSLADIESFLERKRVAIAA
jgi:excisionase family DNA binding protein